MLLFGKTSKCMNIKRRLFLFCVLLSEAQTEIPVKSVNHRSLTLRTMLGGVIRRCWKSKKATAFTPSGSRGEAEGSQSGRSACSVLCTSSGRSFGLLFA